MINPKHYFQPYLLSGPMSEQKEIEMAAPFPSHRVQRLTGGCLLYNFNWFFENKINRSLNRLPEMPLGGITPVD